MAGGPVEWNSETDVHNVSQTQNSVVMAVTHLGTVLTLWEQWDPVLNRVVVMGQWTTFDGEPLGLAAEVASRRLDEAPFPTGKPAVIALPDGNFQVAYQKVGANGTTIELAWHTDWPGAVAPITIHTNGSNPAENIEIVGLADGRTLVMWEQDGAILGKYVSATGGVVDANVTTFAPVSASKSSSSLVTTSVGSTYVAGWIEQAGTSTTNLVLRFIREDTPFTLTINSYNNASATAKDLDITALGSDRVLVSWLVVNGGSTTISGRIFNSNGVAATTEFAINSDGIVDSQPVVTCLGGIYANTTDFVVAWIETVGGVKTIKAQVFDEVAIERGPSFTVATEVNGGFPKDLQILSHGDGRFTVKWTNAFNDAGGYIRTQTFDTRATGITWDGTNQDDHYVGTIGNDILKGGGGINRLAGHDGDDTLEGGASADTLKGGLGNDRFISSDGTDFYHGGAGRDTVSYWGAATAGGIAIYMTDGSKSSGQAQFDTFSGIEVIDGGTGNDTIEGNGEDNTFWGDDGDDQLFGLGGNDTLKGGNGNDYLVGGAGEDLLEGGAGTRDTVSYFGASKGVAVYLTHMQDNTNDAYGDEFYGIEVIDGSTHADTIEGDANANYFRGDSGNDSLSGLAGVDTLEGGAGDDVLEGGLGGDILKGGAEFDIADYSRAESGVIADLLASGNNTNEADGDTYDLIEGLRGSSHSDTLRGSAGDNKIWGGGSRDVLDGREGADTLDGGEGNDILFGGIGDYDDSLDGAAGDDSLNGQEGRDTLNGGTGRDSLDGGAGNDKLDGGANNDSLIGGDGVDTLLGGDGDDTLDGGVGNDSLDGGTGNDVYHVDGADDIVVETDKTINGGTADKIITTATYTLNAGTGIEILQAAEGNDAIDLTGSDSENNKLIGNTGNNTLNGLGGNDTLEGGGGHDVFKGGLGADSMTGGSGNDTYYVDNAGDRIVETIGASGGTDTLFISTINTFKLNDTIGIEVIKVDAGITHGVDIEGNSQANTIIGGDGNDILNGGGGADSLVGGKGDDTYRVDNAADVVSEGIDAGGKDIVFASTHYTLASGTGIETLQAAEGNDAINLTGSDIENNTLIGNAGNNILNGMNGSDTLIGGGGHDVFKGGLGADSMVGGTGNDTYYVDDVGDLITDAGGIDTIVTITSRDLTDIHDIENLTAWDGIENIDLSGNAIRNVLKGNEFDNELNGEGGNDTLEGHGGNDTLKGGLGADSMVGGAGDDIYYVDDAGDVLQETISASGGTDTVHISTATFKLADMVGVEVLKADTSITVFGFDIEGNNRDNTIVGSNQNDTLRSGGGVDELDGGKGNDIYYASVDDTIKDSEGTKDTVMALEGGTYTLTGIETLVATAAGTYAVTGVATLEAQKDTDGIHLIGDDNANTLAGNDRANTLEGGLGDDTITGAGGDDTIKGGGGVDSLDGGALNDHIEGGVGNNDDFLDGGSGNDTLIGGDGGDTYYIDSKDDVIVERLEDTGTDRIETTSNYRLGADVYVESIKVMASSGREVIGNDETNSISGNGGNDTLIGGGGNDLLSGFAGADTLKGGQGADMLLGQDDGDTYFVDASDTIIENGVGGRDTVVVTESYSIEDLTTIEDLEVEVAPSENRVDLTGNDIGNKITGNDGVNVIDGKGGNDTLFGGGGNDELLGGIGLDSLVGGIGDDTLNGGADNDTLEGGGGIDTYYVTQGDTVTDTGAEKGDTVIVVETGTYSLSAGIEIGTINGNVTGVTLTGNVSDNTLNGNNEINTLNGDAGDDKLYGNGGGDTLHGGADNDLLDGGAGADKLYGGTGTDTYYIDDINDLIQDDGGAGDHAEIHLVGGTYTLGLGVDTATLTVGATDVHLKGNGSDNILNGNGSENSLSGGSGNDELYGHGGADKLYGDEGSDTLWGDIGNDVLDGGEGADVLHGGDGADTYHVNDLGDIVDEQGQNDGRDLVVTTRDWQLGANLEDLQADATSTANLTLTGNGLNNRVTGNGGHNIIDGGAGADIMTGGDGDDTYYVDNAGDEIVDSSGDHDTARLATGSDLTFEQALAMASVLRGNNIEQVYIDGLLYSAPTRIAFEGGSVNENAVGGTAVGVLHVDDSTTGDTATFSFVDAQGNDIGLTDLSGRFILVNNNDGTWHIEVVEGATFDHETEAAIPVRVRVTDSHGLQHLEELTIAINNVNEAPGTILLNGLTTVTVDENSAAIGTLSAVDPENNPITGYTIVGGDPTGIFEVHFDGTNYVVQVREGRQLDYEALGENKYLDLILTADAGGQTSRPQTIRVNVNNVNDRPGTILLNDATTVEVTENTTLIGTLSADDQDGDAITYSLELPEGLEGLLTLVLVDGEWTIQVANDRVLDFETLGGTITVVVTASDGRGGTSSPQPITINIRDITNEVENNVYEVFPDSKAIVEDLNPAVGGIDRANIHVASYVLQDTVGVEILSVADNLTFDVEVTGNSQDNTIYGSTRNDTLRGGGGSDIISDDEAEGVHDGGGADELYGDAGNDTLAGGLGNDQLFGGDDNDTLYGGDDDDRLEGGSGSDRLEGGNGNDVLDGGLGGPDILKGGAGDDIYWLRNAGDVIEFDEGGDDGEDTAYVLSSNIGNNEAIASYVSSLKSNGVEHVYVDGRLYGEIVPEVSLSNYGVRELATASSAVGVLSVENAAPGETFRYEIATDENNNLLNADGRFTITGDLESGFRVRVVNGVKLDFEQNTNHAITVKVTDSFGLSHTQIITINVRNLFTEVTPSTGLSGNDTIKAGAGNDQLNGGGGNDKLYGGEGRDELTGGTGADVFVFDSNPLQTNRDVITDFTRGQDLIHLDNAIFTRLAEGALSVGQFHIGSTAADTGDRIIYNRTTGSLLYDVDGSGRAAAVQITILANRTELQASDFLII